MKNIFLSGEINVGKSTIIQHIIKSLNISREEIGGFYTRAYVEKGVLRGFYIDPIKYEHDLPSLRDRLIGYTPDGEVWMGRTDTFEGLGVEILNYCLNQPFKLIIMDELGFFENTAFKFQAKVHEVLSSDKRVLGVIKPISTPFMDSIRNRKDVEEIEITRNNRDAVARVLAKRFRL